MADILPFKARKVKPTSGNSLCRNGHHKWQVVAADPFAVRRGELITRYRCQRCGKERVTSH